MREEDLAALDQGLQNQTLEESLIEQLIEYLLSEGMLSDRVRVILRNEIERNLTSFFSVWFQNYVLSEDHIVPVMHNSHAMTLLLQRVESLLKLDKHIFTG